MTHRALAQEGPPPRRRRHRQGACSITIERGRRLALGAALSPTRTLRPSGTLGRHRRPYRGYLIIGGPFAIVVDWPQERLHARCHTSRRLCSLRFQVLMKSLPAPSRVILTAVGTAVTKTVSRAEATRYVWSSENDRRPAARLQSAASALEAAGARVVGEVCARVQQPDDPK